MIVGNPYEIWCKVQTDPEVHSDIVNISWIAPNGDAIVTNDRISVIPITSDGNNHTSQLQFLYLSDEDEGLYVCNVAILSTTDSMSFELEKILSKFSSIYYV